MSSQPENINRRRFLQQAASFTTAAALSSAGLAALTSANASAAPTNPPDADQYDFLMGRVKFLPDWGDKKFWAAWPGSDKNLLQELSSVVRCKVKLPPRCHNTSPDYGSESQFNAVVDFTDMQALRNLPFLFMTSEYPYTFSTQKKQNLKQYILEGGFLLMDDCVNVNKIVFYDASYRMLEEIFAPGSVKPIPLNHEVFHNVYDFGKKGLPHIHTQGPYTAARGVFIGERLAVFLSSTDIHCAWSKDWYSYLHLYEPAIRIGINIIMYAISH